MSDDVDSAVEVGQLLASRVRLRILAYLRSNGPSTMAQLADGLDTTRQSLQRPVTELRDAGWLTTTAEPPAFRPLVMDIDRSAIQNALGLVTRTIL